MFGWITQWFGRTETLPRQWQDQDLRTMALLAVDLELTSLDTKTAKITSIGWVEGKHDQIDMDSCFYEVVRTRANLHQSPVIHGLTEETVAQGVHIKDVLETLRHFAKTHIWVCHNAALDLGVLKRVMVENQLFCDDIVVLDTLTLAVYQLKKHHEVVPANSASLAVCRQRLGLPAAPAHNALDDAMATLQLWFAQNAAMNGNKQIRVGDLLHTNAILCKKMQKK